MTIHGRVSSLNREGLAKKKLIAIMTDPRT